MFLQILPCAEKDGQRIVNHAGHYMNNPQVTMHARNEFQVIMIL